MIVEFAEILSVLDALTMSMVSVRPAVSVVDDVAAKVTSNAADVSRIARPVSPASVPPVIATLLAACVLAVSLYAGACALADTVGGELRAIREALERLESRLAP